MAPRKKSLKKTGPTKNRKLRGNVRPGLIILTIPLIALIVVGSIFLTGTYSSSLGAAGDSRLITENWQQADSAFKAQQPTYERKFAYYKLKDGQSLASVADYFSVDPQELAKLNPGTIVPGTTLKVPPVEHALAPVAAPNGKLGTAVVTDDRGLLRINQPYRYELATTTIPDLMNFLKPYNAIEQTGPKTFRINRSISLEGNIRIDITSDTVTKLELRSAPHDVTCLCLDQASALLKDMAITSYDPATGLPDKSFEDERAFVRDKNGRMDAINVDFSYLGNDLPNAQKATANVIQREGGIYGVSWRISDDMLGVEIATGWVERSSFTHNHYGAYTFGASGMMWRDSYFAYNDIYGLDPHDDSNNAMIEDNLFAHNGKHGFIVSKRCDYNIIRNNTSVDNKLHGFMLHEHSSYNVIENNVAYGNTDNYVLYESDYNTIRNNVGYNARSSQVRINQNSRNSYVTGNKLIGGRRGVYTYGNTGNVYVSGNTISVQKEVLTTDKSKNVLFANNAINGLHYKVTPGDRLIFGTNTITNATFGVPRTAPLPKGYTLKKY